MKSLTSAVVFAPAGNTTLSPVPGTVTAPVHVQLADWLSLPLALPVQVQVSAAWACAASSIVAATMAVNTSGRKVEESSVFTGEGDM